MQSHYFVWVGLLPVGLDHFRLGLDYLLKGQSKPFVTLPEVV